MNTHDTCKGYCIEQLGDVAMTDELFGMLLEILLGNTVQKVNGTIAAS
jgi:hypothetical protein